MSDVSLEAESGTTSAEDPQQDCEEADKAKESLSEDLTPESVDSSRDAEDREDVLYDIDIDSDEDRVGSPEKDVQDEGSQSVSAVSGSVGKEAKHRVESSETPEENGDSRSETKVIFTVELKNQRPALRFARFAFFPWFAGGGGSFFSAQSKHWV